MKTLKFKPELAKLILEGTKTSTWRLFDDKNLSVRDKLSFLDSESKKEFTKAIIISLKETTFDNLKKDDFQGHESFSSKEEMFKKYSIYYNKNVDGNTNIKIIKFKLI